MRPLSPCAQGNGTNERLVIHLYVQHGSALKKTKNIEVGYSFDPASFQNVESTFYENIRNCQPRHLRKNKILLTNHLHKDRCCLKPEQKERPTSSHCTHVNGSEYNRNASISTGNMPFYFILLSFQYFSFSYFNIKKELWETDGILNLLKILFASSNNAKQLSLLDPFIPL